MPTEANQYLLESNTTLDEVIQTTPEVNNTSEVGDDVI